MSKQQLNRLFRSIAAALLVGAFALSAGCNKQPGGAGAPQGQSHPAQTAAPQGQDSDEGDDGPEIPGTLDGRPATMSEDAFLSAYRQVDGVIALNDGLMYRVLSTGQGKSPKLSDTVKVTYRGTLMDGSVFDETKPGEPIALPLARVIPGWQEALQLMKEGDKWEVVIPSALGYGEAGAPPKIPPNTPLVFEITLVEVVKS